MDDRALDFEITLHRRTGNSNRQCGGCEKNVTAEVLSIEGAGHVLFTLAICAPCQALLADAGIAIETPQDRTAEELISGGMSERLARLVARRWTR